ncbi:Enoyl-CoA hydratase/carnithine racemase [Duganella sp. CF517]|uniref:enoyl-CoA hydratase/isomerase family protein n=1 Tax=Duganella sp. CF517 TaxID=1881038 RepID=UPI0008AC0609|nr:enoyl-CoA hydratase-related protein [Duganella sp. CF517]SEO09669.1 Enoyl-CoA hydratase/carnithine racemase [Duganella sp. CF517]
MLLYDTPPSTAATFGDVTLDISHALATITIARPSKINAIRLETWQALRALVVAADNNPAVGVIVVRGSGGHFSAGNDISVLSTFPGNPADALVFGAAWADAIAAVEDTVKPVIMAIEGICYGSALALSLAGDVRIAAAGATFSIPVAKLGALYLRSDYQRLVATVGMGQSKKLIYASEAFGAEQALRIGLVEEVFPQDRFEQELQRLVDTLLARSPFTLLRSKSMLRGLGHADARRETGESLAAFAEATQCADFAEGISAFLQRRTARFR